MKQLVLSIIIVCLSATSFAIAPITGSSGVCTGDTTTLYDATGSGIWSSGTAAIATIGSSSGIVTGITTGTAIITYTAGGTSVTKTITVNPTPTLSSPFIVTQICDSGSFNYVPMSSTAGTTFTWSRATVLGISNSAATGTGTIFENLYNTDINPIAAIYVYTLTAGSCTNVQNISVLVNPTPELSSPLTLPSICDTGNVFYMPTSPTTGALFAWDRPAITGISPTTNFSSPGTGIISERLANGTTSAITVSYIYRLSINICTNLFTQTVSVTIDACPLGINNITNPLKDISIFPNPTSGQFIADGLDGASSVIVTDMLGRKVFSRNNIGTSEVIIDLRNEPKGVYFLLASAQSGTISRKIVKE